MNPSTIVTEDDMKKAIPNDDQVPRNTFAGFPNEEVHIGVAHPYADYTNGNSIVAPSDDDEAPLR